MTDDNAKSPDKPRLDQLLVQRGHFETRARARDAVTRGTVSIDGVVSTRPGARFDPQAAISVSDKAQKYVSRAALKLIAGLDHFGFDPADRSVLDIGASTGGFSQVLLERGAAHVSAVDVGHGQLHPALESDPRLSNHEGVNARNLAADDIGGRDIDAVVSDVSFISLRLALPPALSLAAPGSFCVLLVKPQFEAGKDALGKGGLLKDPSLGPRIAKDLSDWLGAQPGWESKGTCPSPIEGGGGNREFLLGGLKR
ncbi:TlyA family RNA methyltransferase [Nitratireductor sp. XY-223]|uniref:TlyA family RNA methyltransferase n=1 Tax=Nitratireductor sp. XY-223 TaxID=2561926 RepID=UPI0010A9C58D|nr:TlyA family RNA methyltransferase [Nitratireductor sp. XY-223]